MDMLSSFEDSKSMVKLLLEVDSPCLRRQLSREQLRRLATQMQSGNGARALWEFVLQMCQVDAEDWADAAALVFTVLHDKLLLEIRALPAELLNKALGLLRDEPYRVAQARDIFGDALGVGSREGSLLLLAQLPGST